MDNKDMSKLQVTDTVRLMAVKLQGAEPADGPAVADPVLAHGCSVLAYRRAPEATLSAGP